MGNLTIQIGQGENKTINFKITTTVFNPTDELLFAVKTDLGAKKQVFSKRSQVSNIDYINGVYFFSVVLNSEQTRAFAVRTYSYDLTLVDSYGQAKPLIDPQDLIVTGTVGASVKQEV